MQGLLTQITSTNELTSTVEMWIAFLYKLYEAFESNKTKVRCVIIKLAQVGGCLHTNVVNESVEVCVNVGECV